MNIKLLIFCCVIMLGCDSKNNEKDIEDGRIEIVSSQSISNAGNHQRTRILLIRCKKTGQEFLLYQSWVGDKAALVKFD